ncbi:hypothetical protein ANCCAN_30175, partial [Ancylostoma caninum]
KPEPLLLGKSVVDHQCSLTILRKLVTQPTTITGDDDDEKLGNYRIDKDPWYMKAWKQWDGEH